MSSRCDPETLSFEKSKTECAHKFSTRLELLKQVDPAGQGFINAFKKLCNDRPSLVWYHPKDRHGESTICGCAYDHWHILWYSTIRLGDDSIWRAFKQKCAKAGVILKQSIIEDPMALTQHLMSPPRLLVGVRASLEADQKFVAAVIRGVKSEPTPDVDASVLGAPDGEITVMDVEPDAVNDDAWFKMGFIYHKSAQTVSDQPGPSAPAQIPLTFDDFIQRVPVATKRSVSPSFGDSTMEKKLKTKTPTRVRTERLSEYFKQYNAQNMVDLMPMLKRVNDLEAIEFVKGCMAASNNQHIEKTAQSFVSIDLQDEDKDLIQMFLDKELETDPELYLSIEDTEEKFFDWAEEQNIDGYYFIVTIFLLLKGALEKKHALILQGASNAGKTAWLNTFLYMSSMAGHIEPLSKTFPFEQLVNSRFGRFDELQLTTETVQQYKKLFAGEDIVISIKHKQGVKVKGQPCFGSCNENIYTFISITEREAIETRCVMFSNLKRSNVLAEMKGMLLNAKFAQDCYHRLNRVRPDKLKRIYNDMEDDIESPRVKQFRETIFRG